MIKIRIPLAFIFLKVSAGHTASTDDQEATESSSIVEKSKQMSEMEAIR